MKVTGIGGGSRPGALLWHLRARQTVLLVRELALRMTEVDDL